MICPQVAITAKVAEDGYEYANAEETGNLFEKGSRFFGQG